MMNKSCFPKDAMNMIISPIGSSVKNNKGLIDYKEQLERTKIGNENWCWDDSRYNTAQPGELFAFFFPRSKNCTGKVVVHRILSVKSPTHRLPSWSENVGQSNRNVLELSPQLKVYTMDEWEQLCGPMSKMGTYQTDLSVRKLLFDDLKAHFVNAKEETNRGKEEKVEKVENNEEKVENNEEKVENNEEKEEIQEADEFVVKVVLEDIGAIY
jgi:hypothetical protein